MLLRSILGSWQSEPLTSGREAKPTRKNCHCSRNVTVAGVTVSGEACTDLLLHLTTLLHSLIALQRPAGAHDPDRQQGGPGAEARRLLGRRPRDGAAARRALHGDVGQGPAAEHRRRLQGRHPFSKACLQHSQTVIQPCMWFLHVVLLFGPWRTGLAHPQPTYRVG